MSYYYSIVDYTLGMMMMITGIVYIVSGLINLVLSVILIIGAYKV
jgi:hypothetical protein